MHIKAIAPRLGTTVTYDREAFPDSPLYGPQPARVEVASDVFAFRNGTRYVVRFPFDEDANLMFRNVSGARFEHGSGWSCNPTFPQDLIEALQDIADVIHPDMTGFRGDRKAAHAAAVEAVTLRRQERTSEEARAHGERLAAARAAREAAKNAEPDDEPAFSM